jgi:hypothetical protein
VEDASAALSLVKAELERLRGEEGPTPPLPPPAVKVCAFGVEAAAGKGVCLWCKSSSSSAGKQAEAPDPCMQVYFNVCGDKLLIAL